MVKSNALVILVGLGFLCSITASASSGSKPIPLSGEWRFQLDRADAGLKDRWFAQTLAGKINLPGSLPAQGIGDDIATNTPWTGEIVDKSWFIAPEYVQYRQPGNIKVPFWLQPEKYYAGAAWYQRGIDIPKAWAGQRVTLTLERPHWETRVWIDDRIIGTNNALATPHDYDLGLLAPGKHRLTIRVDNRVVVDIGPNSHSITDHTQGNWNGLVGRIELRCTPQVWIEDLQVYPQADARKVRVRVTTMNATGRRLEGKLSLFIKPGPGALPLNILPVSQNYNSDATKLVDELEVSLGASAQTWDEFSPALYRIRAELRGQADHANVYDERASTFGLREIATQSTQFLINGRKAFFRGTLECCIFPKTGHPPTDVESWKRLIGVAKSYGLNLIRFHSWCPPEAAFMAADELGFYLHVEASAWANSTSSLGDGKPVDAWIYQETDRILKYYGNHPSFVLMPYGNEPGGRHHAEFLAKWVNHYKARDPRRLFTAGAGWPQIPENQFHLTPDPRIQAWGGGLNSRINARAPETRTDYRDYIQKRTVPVISHEIGQWCVYPNFDEMRKYTGYLKPKNFEIFRDSLGEHHMGDLARQFLLASGKLQTLCYKEDIESALRTTGMGGFELLDLHDFPGQGTALVGVLDPFWGDKGYVTAREYSRFCNYTVPLARLAKRIFCTNEKLDAGLEVAHFGPVPLENAATVWKLVNDNGKSVAQGQLPAKTIPVDNGIALGNVSIDLSNLPAPARYKLVVGLAGTKFENDWDVWVYPAQVDTQTPLHITIAEELNDQALAALEAGGSVLLAIPPKRVHNAARHKVLLGFSSIFWNTAWTSRQPPTTLGILCDPKHPLFGEFPTDYHSNWQWWYLISRASAMILDDLPVQLQPTVRVIDDWFTARRLGLLFEARVGRGKIIVCSIDLQHDLETNPVARQFQVSLLRYMAGNRFNPSVTITAGQVRSLTIY